MMKPFRSYGWIAVLCIGGAAAVMAQRQRRLEVPAATDARALSRVFRDVAQRTLPSIVAIQTRGKTVRMSRESPFGDDNPLLPEFFRGDPRFRRFFEDLENQEFRRPSGQGSGFIIDAAGVIMTNSHVVADADQVVVRLHDGREFVATDVKTDKRSDVAILRIDTSDILQPVRLGSTDAMEIGDWVLAVGSPFGYDLTVTQGIISAKGRDVPGIPFKEFIQTDAAINPGNSGGPLLNLNGDVIGINTAISTRSGGYDGISFAIPVNMASWVADQLVNQGQVKRAYLGVMIQDIDSTLARQFNLSVPQGVVITDVVPDSPAAEADLQPGDVVVELNGRRITSRKNMQSMVERLKFGKKYRLTVIRGGERIEVPVTVRELAEEDQPRTAPPDPVGGLGDSARAETDFGLEVQELTADIARQLKLRNVQGVLVRTVERNSPAAHAGIRPGDVITSVAKNEVRSVEEFSEALSGQSLEKGILLLIENQNGRQFVVVKKG